MKTFTFADLPAQVDLEGEFDETCELTLSQAALESIAQGKLIIRIIKVCENSKISGFTASVESVDGTIKILVGDDNSSVTLGEGSSGVYDLRLWRSSNISIGKNTTSNGITVVCDNSEFICGEDCMFSMSILIQAADQHGIVEIESGSIINNNYRSVVLGDHVWLGRHCTLTANACVGKGSVIGTGAIVTGRIPEKVIAVGTPARVIRENYTWCRSPDSLDYFSQSYIDEHC